MAAVPSVPTLLFAVPRLTEFGLLMPSVLAVMIPAVVCEMPPLATFRFTLPLPALTRAVSASAPLVVRLTFWLLLKTPLAVPV